MAPKYTRIHKRWYDVSEFAHPGGPFALSLCVERDATALFESCHTFVSRAVLRGYLAKMEAPLTMQKELDAIYSSVVATTPYDFEFAHAAQSLRAGDGAADGRTAGDDDFSEETSVRSGVSDGSHASPGRSLHSSPVNEEGASSSSPPIAAGLRRRATDGSRPSKLVPVSGVLSPSREQGGSDAGSHPGSRVEDAGVPVVDAFEGDVKALALAYFEGEAARRGVSLRDAMKAPPVRWAQVGALTLLFVLGGVVPLVRGWWPALLITPTIAWIWMVNFWHDAAHFAMSGNWRVNTALTYLAPWFSSPLMWAHQHTIGHHVYTNIPGKDPDLYHAPRLWRLNSSLRWNAVHGMQAWTTLPLWFVSVPTLLLLKPLVALRTLIYNRCVPLVALPPWRIALHLAGRSAVAASLYAWPSLVFAGEPAKAAAFSIVPIGVYSLWFMACSQVNHHTEETSHAFSPSWYRHQASTSHNVAPDSALAFWLSGGLNLQIEHHLFPTVNHWHLRALQPGVAALALKHGVPYLASPTITAAFVKLWEHLRVMARRPPSPVEGGALGR
jgi:fatty acid desaturase